MRDVGKCDGEDFLCLGMMGRCTLGFGEVTVSSIVFWQYECFMRE